MYTEESWTTHDAKLCQIEANKTEEMNISTTDKDNLAVFHLHILAQKFQNNP